MVNNTTMRKIPKRTRTVSTSLVARAVANTARVARGSVKARARASRGIVTRAANWRMARASARRVKGKGKVWGGDWDKGGDRKGYGKGSSAGVAACSPSLFAEFSSNGCSQSSNGSPLTGFELGSLGVVAALLTLSASSSDSSHTATSTCTHAPDPLWSYGTIAETASPHRPSKTRFHEPGLDHERATLPGHGNANVCGRD